MSPTSKEAKDISDLNNLADSEESGQDYDVTLSTCKPELRDGSDGWNCVSCGEPNTPYMRYCHRCWEVSSNFNL